MSYKLMQKLDMASVLWFILPFVLVIIQTNGAEDVICPDVNMVGSSAYLLDSKIIASDLTVGPAEYAIFGYDVDISVSINVTRIIVGAYNADNPLLTFGNSAGKVYIYKLNEDLGEWEEQIILTTFQDQWQTDTWFQADYFGHGVAIDDNVAVCGTSGDDDQFWESGAIYIFHQTASYLEDDDVWELAGKWHALDGGKKFAYMGSTVTMHGNYIAASAPGYVNNTGRVHILEQDDTEGWVEVSVVQGSNSVLEDAFGVSLDMEDDLLIVGALYGDGEVFTTGTAYIFERHNTEGWQQIALLQAGDGANSDFFGFGTAISGDYAACGAPNNDGRTGSVYIFLRTSYTGEFQYTQVQNLVVNDGFPNHYLGKRIALDGPILIASAYGDDDRAVNAGAVYMWNLQNSTSNVHFIHTGKLLAKNGREEDTLGQFGLAIGGKEYLVIGAHLGDGLNNDTGSVYVLKIECDPCDADACLNGATCAATTQGYLDNTYTCACEIGWEGDMCEQNIDDCLSNPCSNNGICSDFEVNQYVCNCTDTGYIGATCDVDADDCKSNPCEHGGICNDTGLHSFECDCSQTGAYGVTCSEDVDDCAVNPCAHDGTCTDLGFDAWTCDCDEPWVGLTCNATFTDCTSTNPCIHGNCLDAEGSFVCECYRGYTDLLCSLDIDDCLSSPCYNGGTCTDAGIAMFDCACTTDYTDVMCLDRIDHCVSSPCMNDTTCVLNDSTGYTCLNNSLWNNTQQQPIPSSSTSTAFPTACLSSPCELGTACVNQDNSVYECIFIDPCLSNPCSANLLCLLSDDHLTNEYICTEDTSSEGVIRMLEVTLVFIPAHNVTQDQLLEDLPELIAPLLGISSNNYDISYSIDDNGLYTIYIVYGNYSGMYTADEARSILQDDENLAIYASNDIQVSVYDHHLEDSDDISNNSDNNDDIVLILLLALAGSLLLLSGGMFFAWRYHSKNEQTKLTLTMPT